MCHFIIDEILVISCDPFRKSSINEKDLSRNVYSTFALLIVIFIYFWIMKGKQISYVLFFLLVILVARKKIWSLQYAAEKFRNTVSLSFIKASSSERLAISIKCRIAERAKIAHLSTLQLRFIAFRLTAFRVSISCVLIKYFQLAEDISETFESFDTFLLFRINRK
jgi:hypothetical protein